ncbi:MAG: hypothetical protein MUF54_12340 [Polyangiaceae bacterium]|nr:hypothetical protein [Polyangiaceae bacterium]
MIDHSRDHTFPQADAIFVLRCRHELAELEDVEASGALRRFATSDLVVLAAVSLRPPPRSLGNVAHDRL